MEKQYRVHDDSNEYLGEVTAADRDEALSAAYVRYADQINLETELSVFPA